VSGYPIQLHDFLLLGLCVAVGLGRLALSIRRPRPGMLKMLVLAAVGAVVLIFFAGGGEPTDAREALGPVANPIVFCAMWLIVCLASLMTGEIAGRAVGAGLRWSRR